MSKTFLMVHLVSLNALQWPCKTEKRSRNVPKNILIHWHALDSWILSLFTQGFTFHLDRIMLHVPPPFRWNTLRSMKHISVFKCIEGMDDYLHHLDDYQADTKAPPQHPSPTLKQDVTFKPILMNILPMPLTPYPMAPVELRTPLYPTNPMHQSRYPGLIKYIPFYLMQLAFLSSFR